jgi:hypothetical protein
MVVVEPGLGPRITPIKRYGPALPANPRWADKNSQQGYCGLTGRPVMVGVLGAEMSAGSKP